MPPVGTVLFFRYKLAEQGQAKVVCGELVQGLSLVAWLESCEPTTTYRIFLDTKLEDMKDHVMPTQRVGGLLVHHALTWMIFLCTLVCYMERQGFPIAFTVLANNAKLSEEVKGRVLSSFFFGYSVMQIPGGWLAARYGGFRILGLSFALWGLTSLLMPGTIVGTNTVVITACRIVIGVSQGMFIPACHTLLAQWIPVQERSRLVSLAMSGM